MGCGKEHKKLHLPNYVSKMKRVGRLPIVKDLFRKLRHSNKTDLPWVSLRVEYGNSIF
jgi:hypothetical protein